jgi:hypothetical protein
VRKAPAPLSRCPLKGLARSSQKTGARQSASTKRLGAKLNAHCPVPQWTVTAEKRGMWGELHHERRTAHVPALHAHPTVAQTGEYLHLGLAEGRPLPLSGVWSRFGKRPASLITS